MGDNRTCSQHVPVNGYNIISSAVGGGGTVFDGNNDDAELQNEGGLCREPLRAFVVAAARIAGGGNVEWAVKTGWVGRSRSVLRRRFINLERRWAVKVDTMAMMLLFGRPYCAVRWNSARATCGIAFLTPQ